MSALIGQEQTHQVAADRDQFLTFTLGDEEYGVEILKVQEIKGYTTPTPIPNTPPWVKGVINLRGVILPIFDLRLAFGLPPADYTKFTVVVVVVLRGRQVGLVVDAVTDVVDVLASDVQPLPDLGAGARTNYARGMAKMSDRLVILLDVDAVIRPQEDTQLASAAG